MTPFASLPDLVLKPLEGRSDAAWYRAPPGKWCPAKIVEHVTLGMEWSARGFMERRARDPMVRRRPGWQGWVARFLVFGVGWTPSGFEAPAMARPTERPDPKTVDVRFRDAVAEHLQLALMLLPARRHDLFVRNPRLGDLTLEEWMRFHVWHCGHHAKQIRRRLAG